jgi:small-conductance mechanosensitive channel
MASIAVQASSLAGLIRSIDETLAAPASQQRIADGFAASERNIRARAQRLEETLERSYDRGDLDTMQSVWRATASDLAGGESSLSSRLSTLTGHRAELDRQAGIWEETARVAEQESAPAEVRAAVSKSLKDLRSAQRKLRKSRDAALGLQKNVVALQAIASAQLDAISAARDEVLRHVWERNELPIWNLQLGDVKANQESFRVALEEALDAIRIYTSKHVPLFVLHGLLIAGLVWLGGRSRRAVLATQGTTGLDMPPALGHPYAAGLLLGLTATIWLHGDAPPKFVQLVRVAVVPFWFLVLRSLLPEALRRPLIGLLALVLIDLLRHLLLDFDVVARILLIVESAAGFAGIFWLRRPARLGTIPLIASLFWTRLLGIWLHFSLIVSALATVSAVAGWTNLADLAISGIARGTFVGSILFAAVCVLEGISEASARTGLLDRVRLIHHDPDAFLKVVQRTGRAFGLFTWLYLLLDALALRSMMASAVTTALATPLGYRNVQVSLGGVLAFGVAIWVSWLLSRFLAAFLNQEVFSRVRLPRGVPFALATITRYTILVLGFVTAVAALGIEVGNLALLISALGVGIGFGMQNMVNNFISGLILLFERPIKVGDRISIDLLLGVVTRIGIRSSIIRTFDGADVIVPNGDLISNQVTNWTFGDTRRRVIVPVGVVYGTPARKVLELLADVAAANPDIIQQPAPMPLFVGFGDSSLDFELRAWTESEDALTLVRSALTVAIQDALAEADIEVPFPQRDLHLKTLPTP